MSSIQIGIIGGSGLYDMAELSDREEREIETPFGPPSAPYVVATLRGRRVAFLARHGHGHRLLPSELNFRANIYGFKVLGVEWILSASAVGSLREDIRPLDMVIPTQFLDRTFGRVGTFFGDGIVAHVGFARPLCAHLSAVMGDAAAGTGATVHRGGTYVCMEGPQFSTVAESNFYRAGGFDIIGMTNLQEAKLAREAEILLLDPRAGHRLRLLASRARLGHGRDGRGQHDAERPDRAGGHRQRGRAAASRADVRVRHGPGHGHHHAAGRHPGGRQGAARPHHRQVHARRRVSGYPRCE